MMRNLFRIIRIVLLGLAVLLFIPETVLAADIIMQGTCGNEVVWVFDGDGVLTISGAGAMTDYAQSDTSPWMEEDVYELVINEGVTHIGDNAFSGMAFDLVTLPESLVSIGNGAFDACIISEAHFSGNLKQWEKDISIGSDKND